MPAPLQGTRTALPPGGGDRDGGQPADRPPGPLTKKHLSATVYYLFTGMLAMLPSLAASAGVLPLWRFGDSLAPLSLAALHLLVLGGMMTVAFGVLYQIVTIAFQAPPVPRHVLFWHLPLHIAATLAMAAGFLTYRWSLVSGGGGLLVAGALAYLALVGRTWMRARNRTFVHRGLILPFLSLWLTVSVGLFQALCPGRVNEAVLRTHAAAGGFAFWTGLVMVLSYKLIPMFAISHGYKASLPRSAGLYYTGVVSLLVAGWLPPGPGRGLTGAGSLLMLAGLASFLIDVAAIVRARKRQRMVPPVRYALAATTCTALGQAWMAAAVWSRHAALLVPGAYLMTFGGLLPLMFAYMQKIVPFLWFEYRFSKRPERKTAPLIDDMVPRPAAAAGMVLWAAGVIAGMAALLVPAGGRLLDGLAVASAVGLCAGVSVLFAALRHVLTIGGPRPDDDIA
ncbi:MAG: hypothetical protein IRZ33_07110 [Alicyclobacillaceae bacterium]|nr:hypothetical protein [Alicyclobacillaceae bacterium]